ncbi:MAG: putative 2-phosphosulfolactate phosphatase [Candidatus Dichloromethanomonas elyunquensis]|nr:MAG: putative 2-phosphosulfolactate phosphatase [Candidatus Dichloromethanomonas elyunquensis]
MLVEVLPVAGYPWIPPLSDRIAVVIDVFRATSTMVTALANGCQAIIPVLSTEEAIERRISEPGSLLGGERKALRIEGFDLGNSPFDYTPEKVGGKKVIMTTTNGTRAIQAVADACKVYIASFLNVESIAHAIFRFIEVHKDIRGIAIACSGSEDRFDIPDIVCAGMLIEALGGEMQTNDLGLAAQMLYNIAKADPLEILRKTEHGKLLVSLGFEKDMVYCSTANILPIVPILENGEIIWNMD